MEPETAEAMMEMLPNVEWKDFATKADLDALGTSVRGEMSELRADLRGEMSELRADIRGEISQGTRTTIFAMIASQATLVGLVLAASRLG